MEISITTVLQNRNNFYLSILYKNGTEIIKDKILRWLRVHRLNKYRRTITR